MSGKKDKVKDKDSKKNTSLRLDKDKLKKLKILAIENDTSIQKILEDLIERYLEENHGGSPPQPKA